MVAFCVKLRLKIFKNTACFFSFWGQKYVRQNRFITNNLSNITGHQGAPSAKLVTGTQPSPHTYSVYYFLVCSNLIRFVKCRTEYTVSIETTKVLTFQEIPVETPR